MTLSSKRELIQAIRKVYRKSSKAQKGSHLDHLELATGLKRNYLNRLLLHQPLDQPLEHSTWNYSRSRDLNYFSVRTRIFRAGLFLPKGGGLF